jgi:hypothetical protein
MRVLLLTPNWPSSFSKEGHPALNMAEFSGVVFFIVQISQISSENIRACFLFKGDVRKYEVWSFAIYSRPL